MKINRQWGLAAAMAAVIAAGGCDAVDSIGYGGGDLDPRDVETRYSWVLESWNSGRPEGYPAVDVTWRLPRDHAGDPFRVYGRNTRDGGFELIATVTSCSEDRCVYRDRNVRQGERYEYFVATVDAWDGNEIGSSREVFVDVPSLPTLSAPAATPISLDGAVYLRWQSTGSTLYEVLVDQDGTLFEIGETDGTGFLDERAENGKRTVYYLAATDEYGHHSSLSAAVTGIARPDYHSELIYAHPDDSTRSGFRFVGSETENPIVAGTSSNAQLRLEVSGSTVYLTPLGQTRISAGTFTTALTCAPGAEANCESVTTAPSDAQFGSGAVAVSAGNTYTVRVIGLDGRVHYGKVRVQGSTIDSAGRRLVVFDWAYQLIPDERALNRLPG